MYSSFENQDVNDPKCELGATHFLELNAFRSTVNRDAQKVCVLFDNRRLILVDGEYCIVHIYS